MDSQPTDRPQAEAKKKSFLDRFRRSPEPALDVPAFDAPSIDAPISDVPAPAVTGKESQKPSFTQRMRMPCRALAKELAVCFWVARPSMKAC